MGKFIRGDSSAGFNKLLIASICVDILFLIMGIIIILMPENSTKLIGIIIGVLFVIAGINTIIEFFARDGAKLYSLNLIYGILFCTLGLVVIITPISVPIFITICLAIYYLIIGATRISYAIWLKIGEDKSWLITLCIGIFNMLLGVLLMINPFEGTMALTTIVGIFVILVSVLDLTDVILLKQRKQKISRIFW